MPAPRYNFRDLVDPRVGDVNPLNGFIAVPRYQVAMRIAAAGARMTYVAHDRKTCRSIEDLGTDRETAIARVEELNASGEAVWASGGSL